MRERGSGTRMAVDAYIRKKHFSPNIRLELGTNEAVRNSDAANLGITVLSIHSLGDHLNREIKVLNMIDSPLMPNWQIVSLKGKKLSPLAVSFKANLFKGINKKANNQFTVR